MQNTFQSLLTRLREAQGVILTTHRQSDGDGLGAEVALFHGLKKLGKRVRMINVDAPAKKYSFLDPKGSIELFRADSDQLNEADLCLVFDTNDERLVEPLFSALRTRAIPTLFVDHHPVLAQGPRPSEGSYIEVMAASTGELVYQILCALNIPLDADIARALYTSVVFDTQLFRFVKSDPRSHLMAAELLRFEREPEQVHRKLFANYTVAKLESLSRALSKTMYLANERIAFIPVRKADQVDGGLDRDESGDIIDQVMNISTIEVAALLREDAPGRFKLSLRSRGTIEVLSLAESFGGGGHRYASGAYIEGSFEDFQKSVIAGLERLVPAASGSRTGT